MEEMRPRIDTASKCIIEGCRAPRMAWSRYCRVHSIEYGEPQAERDERKRGARR
jgi:hypothetical protein